MYLSWGTLWYVVLLHMGTICSDNPYFLSTFKSLRKIILPWRTQYEVTVILGYIKFVILVPLSNQVIVAAVADALSSPTPTPVSTAWVASVPVILEQNAFTAATKTIHGKWFGHLPVECPISGKSNNHHWRYLDIPLVGMPPNIVKSS